MVALLEFQSKELLRESGIRLPESVLARSAEEVLPPVGGADWVCKAQVPAKNRAAAGGIRFASGDGSVRDEVVDLLSSEIGGHAPIAVLIEERVSIASEWFVSIIVDPWGSGMVLQVSDAGGSGIERRLSAGDDVSASMSFSPSNLPDEQTILAAFDWRTNDQTRRRIAALCAVLCRIAVERDLLLLEINPLAITVDGDAVVLDAHVTTDDSAEFRQPWVTGFGPDLDLVHFGRAWRRRYGGDFKVIDPAGRVAVLNTGAGAGMLVMDELARNGVSAYDFSDIRSGTPKRRRERFDAAAGLICEGRDVAVVLVNIHAGITDLRTVREDLTLLIDRFGEAGLPTVLRLQGPYSVETSEALEGLPGVVVEPALEAAIAKACELAGGEI